MVAEITLIRSNAMQTNKEQILTGLLLSEDEQKDEHILGELKIVVYTNGTIEIKAENGFPSDIFFIRGILYGAMSKVEAMTTNELVRQQVKIASTVYSDDC